jgi:hypothetical protein
MSWDVVPTPVHPSLAALAIWFCLAPTPVVVAWWMLRTTLQQPVTD